MFGRKGGALSGVAMLTRVSGSSKVWLKANWFEPVCFNEILFCFFWREKAISICWLRNNCVFGFFLVKRHHGKRNTRVVIVFYSPELASRKKKRLFGGRNGTVSPAAILICFCCLSIPSLRTKKGGGVSKQLGCTTLSEGFGPLKAPRTFYFEN